MTHCERCKQPLVNSSEFGYSADGRVVCTRTGCQLVEEIGRRVNEGSLEFVDAEQFAVKIEFPTAANVKGLTLETWIQAVMIKPLPEDPEE